METWKPVIDYPKYEVSNKGRVRNKSTGYILEPLLNKDNYLYVDVYDKPQKPVYKRIHRLVCDAFIRPEPNMVVNHRDGDKHNNVLQNLEWVTAEENSRLAAESGLYKTQPIRIVETGETFGVFSMMLPVRRLLNIDTARAPGPRHLADEMFPFGSRF